MFNLYASIRFVLLAILCLGFVSRSSAAQLQYATAVAVEKNVANAPHAVDNSMATAATLSTSVLAGSSNLRLRFASAVPVGSTAGLMIQVSSNLDVSLFNDITIRTFMGSNVTHEQTLPLNTLINLSLLNSGGGKATVEFPVGKEFNQVELRIGGLVNASFEVELFTAYARMAAPLPVELVGFAGKSTAGGTALAWSTASERNSDHFVVERADGSPEQFRAIGKVQSAGTTTRRTEYAFTDAAPAAASYYRLRQVDRDGTTSFSPVVVVKSIGRSAPLAVYPSPAIETLVVAAAPGTRFAIFDQRGRQLQAGEVPAGARPVLDVRALPGGVYSVRDLSTGSSARFVKAGE